MIFWLMGPFECLTLMILTTTKCHENLLRDSTLSLLSIVIFVSSWETTMILKIPNETFLRFTRYPLIYTRIFFKDIFEVFLLLIAVLHLRVLSVILHSTIEMHVSRHLYISPFRCVCMFPAICTSTRSGVCVSPAICAFYLQVYLPASAKSTFLMMRVWTRPLRLKPYFVKLTLTSTGFSPKNNTCHRPR